MLRCKIRAARGGVNDWVSHSLTALRGARNSLARRPGTGKETKVFDLGIVGFVDWGRRLVTSVQEISDTVRFFAGSDGNPDRIALYSEEHGLRNGDAFNGIEGVVIAGHSASWATDVMGTVYAGKSVLVIKPLATMVEDSESLCAMAAEKGVLAAMDALRKRAKNGGLGRSARHQPAGIPAAGRRDGVGGVRIGRCVPGQAENPRRRRARAGLLAGSIDPRVERCEDTVCGTRAFSRGRREDGGL